jgi:hypothetical protein
MSSSPLFNQPCPVTPELIEWLELRFKNEIPSLIVCNTNDLIAGATFRIAGQQDIIERLKTELRRNKTNSERSTMKLQSST